MPCLNKAEQESKVVWWGCIDANVQAHFLLKTLVLVTNSLYEPGGRVITEAMSEGVPVIAAPNGFALDLIHNWKNGFLVNHGDELSLATRMEHFIRQPFLSNALGENARQIATKEISKWDFIGKHLMAYGLNTSSCESNNVTFTNYFSRREINLFPYRNLPLSSDLLCRFLEECTGEKAISNPILDKEIGTSDIYHIQSFENNYIIKHPYNRLALSSLVLPVRKTEYVRNAGDFYKYEVASYEACQNDILVGKDDIHQLLLLRELKPFDPLTEDYPKIINFLENQCLMLSDDNTLLYNEILSNSNIETIEGIDSLLETLSMHFPDFFFEPNCAFHPYIGWKLAPHLLDYNIALFDKRQAAFLYTICNSFSNAVELSFNENLYEITSDISLQHIMLDNYEISLIDREKRTIGQVEYMIAVFCLIVLIHDPK